MKNDNVHPYKYKLNWERNNVSRRIPKKLNCHTDWVSIAFSSDNQKFFGNDDYRAITCHANSGEKLNQLNGHNSYVISVYFF